MTMTPTQDLIIAEAHVFDGLSDRLTEPRWLRISSGRIVEISDQRLHGADTAVLDARGRTVMPGLIDAHFHAYAADANIPRLETQPLSYLAHHARFLL